MEPRDQTPLGPLRATQIRDRDQPRDVRQLLATEIRIVVREYGVTLVHLLQNRLVVSVDKELFLRREPV